MTSIRTFMAIELPHQTRLALTNLQSQLKAVAPPHSVSWSAPQNIHLTLHFLGDVDASQVDTLADTLNQVTAVYQPFSLNMGGLGCFPNTKRPRVIWVGLLEKSGPLAALQQDLGEKLTEAIGFKPDTRPFSPHLTLGRVKSDIPSRQLIQLSDVLKKERAAVGLLSKFLVEEIKLIKSELKPTGAVYTVLSAGKLSEE